MKRKGMSLVEVLISAGVLSVILSVCVWVFVPALRVWMRSQAKSEVQESALVAARWLRTDVERAAPESLYWDSGELSLVTQGRPQVFDSSGAPEWQWSVTYWLAPTGELHRQAVEIKPPQSQAPALARPSPDPTSHVVARYIYGMDCQLPNPGQVTIHIEAANQEHHYVLDTAASTLTAPQPAPSP